MKNVRNKGGISLIVLVITIIIMIILAAAVIITLNNTGIINTAEVGVEKTNNKQTRLELELVLADLQKEKYGDKKKITDAYIDETLIGKDMLVDGDVVIVQGWLYIIDREKLVVISDGEKAKLNKSINITAESSTTDYKTATITINISGIDNIQKVKIGNGTTETEITEIPEMTNGVYTLTHSVTENGTYSVTVLDNNGGMNMCSVTVSNLEDDMTITTKEDLTVFRDMVNAGVTFEGKTITLEENIDLKCDSTNRWTPINTFNGTFDGNNKTISGLYLTSTASFQGFIGTNNGIVKDLTIKGTVNAGHEGVGAIVGKNNGEIINCKNYATINIVSESGRSVGGVCGLSLNKISRCMNNGDVIKVTSGMPVNIGGVVGGLSGKDAEVTQSGNYANIEGGYQVGGIAGCLYNGKSITECFNKGNIQTSQRLTADAGANIGGITGLCEGTGNVKDCYNAGTVYSKYHHVAGIVGQAYYITCTIENCYNSGSITTDYNLIGNILGRNRGGTTSIVNCYYTPEIAASGNTDGVTTINCSKVTSGELQGYANTLGSVWTSDIKNTDGTWKYNDGNPILKWQLEMNK